MMTSLLINSILISVLILNTFECAPSSGYNSDATTTTTTSRSRYRRSDGKTTPTIPDDSSHPLYHPTIEKKPAEDKSDESSSSSEHKYGIVRQRRDTKYSGTTTTTSTQPPGRYARATDENTQPPSAYATGLKQPQQQQSDTKQSNPQIQIPQTKPYAALDRHARDAYDKSQQDKKSNEGTTTHTPDNPPVLSYHNVEKSKQN